MSRRSSNVKIITSFGVCKGLLYLPLREQRRELAELTTRTRDAVIQTHSAGPGCVLAVWAGLRLDFALRAVVVHWAVVRVWPALSQCSTLRSPVYGFLPSERIGRGVRRETVPAGQDLRRRGGGALELAVVWRHARDTVSCD